MQITLGVGINFPTLGGQKMENNEELTIDINQYIQFDEDGEMKIYIQIDKFLNDALEYLKNDNSEYEIVKE